MLWGILRSRQLNGVKFRRQHAIGPYVVDFCSLQKRLVIELDGSGHAADEQLERDRIRDEYLEQKGYRIVRIWNNELDQNFQGVVDAIENALSASPSPQPSPRGGEGEP